MNQGVGRAQGKQDGRKLWLSTSLDTSYRSKDGSSYANITVKVILFLNSEVPQNLNLKIKELHIRNVKWPMYSHAVNSRTHIYWPVRLCPFHQVMLQHCQCHSWGKVREGLSKVWGRDRALAACSRVNDALRMPDTLQCEVPSLVWSSLPKWSF